LENGIGNLIEYMENKNIQRKVKLELNLDIIKAASLQNFGEGIV